MKDLSTRGILRGWIYWDESLGDLASEFYDLVRLLCQSSNSRWNFFFDWDLIRHVAEAF